MDEEEELKIALEKFAQRVLETIEDDHEELAKKLLLDLDPTAFGRLMSQSSLFSLEHLKRILTQYYESQRNEEINWKSQPLKPYVEDFLILTSIFALDLALSSNKKQYIESIISLTENEQLVLQPFVQFVTMREDFISPRPLPEEEIANNRQHLLDLADENEKLKLERDHWMLKYQDLRQNYDYLKTTHDKNTEELNYLKQERYMLITELGSSECGSVEETIERVKREFQNYEKTIQKQQKQIEEKKTALKSKADELQKFEEAYKSNHYEEKIVELTESKRKIKELQGQLSSIKGREEEVRTDLCRTDQLLLSKEEECLKLRQRIQTLELYQSKYLGIKKLHNQFKSKLVKNMRNADS